MSKKFLVILAIVLVASLVLGACTKSTEVPTTEPTVAPTEEPTVAPTEPPAPKFLACEITDTGGIDDKSFNATAWKGIEDAIAEYGIEGKYLESQEVADYEKNINAFIEEGCDLIIPVGFFLADTTKAAAEANPDVHFSIVDVTYAPPVANINGQAFQTDEAAFLAGYVAAGMTKTGKVGTFGGFPIPTVTIFMDGFARGVKYYNEVKGATVQVIGWDIEKPETGLFSSSFDDQTKGKELGNTLMDQGADIIMPVAGPVGIGTLAAVKERGTGYVIGVDNDWAIDPGKTDYQGIILTSVMKFMDATVKEAIKLSMDGEFPGGKNVVGTMANNGVGLGTLHADVPAELIAEVEALKADIIAGKITLGEAFKVQ